MPRNVAKRAKVSVVTHQDLDSNQEALDNETVIDLGLDMASRMDMMMTMLVDLTNRENGREEESVEQLDAPHPTPAKSQPEPMKSSKWQNTLAQDLDLEETVRR